MTVINKLIKYYSITELNGNIVKVKINQNNQANVIQPRLEDLASINYENGSSSIAQIIQLEKDTVTLQVYGSTQGISMNSGVCFLGHPIKVRYSENILGRIFKGNGLPIDHGPSIQHEPEININTISVNPVMRQIPKQMVRTNIPMIDVFNCLVESQKIPIFARAGEPYNELLKKIAIEADADIVVFGGMGLMYDDFYMFKQAFEEACVFHRTIMFVNLGSDPAVERLLVPDMALTVAEKFAVEQNKRVLVLLSDMTSFADALKEIGISMDKIPSNRGYIGDLYSQLARRYEKACDYKGAGSVTLLTTTTMPGGDITHPVPDNTGYITEGQYFLKDGCIDPFASLSRLKQHVISVQTREDHGQVANALIRLYSEAKDAEQKMAMAFDLSDYDQRLLKYLDLFKENFMQLDSVMTLDNALNCGWQIMQQCFTDTEMYIKQELIDKYGIR